MGIAAYNRGSAAMRQQFDAEAAARPQSFEGLHNRIDYLDRKLSGTSAALTAERADMVRARACIARLRATLAVERDEAHETERVRKQQVAMLCESRGRLERSWRKASAMIRACLTPEQVDAYRLERDGSA